MSHGQIFNDSTYLIVNKRYTALSKKNSHDDPLKLGNVSKRFNLSSKRAKGRIAKDRFAFDQTMQGHDCEKIREGGDFVVQKRDFFGNKIGNPTVYEVKTGNSTLTRHSGKKEASN